MYPSRMRRDASEWSGMSRLARRRLVVRRREVAGRSIVLCRVGRQRWMSLCLTLTASPRCVTLQRHNTWSSRGDLVPLILPPVKQKTYFGATSQGYRRVRAEQFQGA